MKSIFEVLVVVLGVVGATLALIAYGTIAYGTVVYFFYSWFVTPVFISLPVITFTQAIGLGLFMNLFKNHTQPKEIKKEYLEDTKKVTWILPWVLLFFGWLIHLVIR